MRRIQGLDRLRLIRDARGHVAGISFFPHGEGPAQSLLRVAAYQTATQTALPADAQQNLVGNYEFSGVGFRVYLKDRHLIGEYGGHPTNLATLIPETPRKLFAAEVDATAVFKPHAGPAESVTLKAGDEEIELKRTGR